MEQFRLCGPEWLDDLPSSGTPWVIRRFQRRPAAFGRATAPGPAQFAVTRVPLTVPLMCTSSLLSSALYWSVVKAPW